MIAASALILLAEAATACTPPSATRLGGGAVLVRPVGTFDPLPFEPLGPAPSIVSKPTEIQHTAAPTSEGEGSEPVQDQPANQCAAVEIPII